MPTPSPVTPGAVAASNAKREAPRSTPPVAPELPPSAGEMPWWTRSDLCYDAQGQLTFAGRRVGDLAAGTTTPAYFYSAARISANVARLQDALRTLGTPSRLLYATKANRFGPVLAHLRRLGLGLDVCSPGEVRHALACGFREEDLSFTAGSLSRADYSALGGWTRMWVNADSLTAVRRLSEVSPRRTIGLRINPAAGVGYGANPLLEYAGAKATKFGIYRDRFREALALAADLGLRVTGLHCHSGCGFLTPQLPALERVFARIAEFLELAPDLSRLNLGGGLGIPLVAADSTLDLEAWTGLVRRHFGGRGLTLEFEPGDYLVKDAGLLATEVTQVEDKGGRTFVGLNAGFNVHVEPAFYHLPLAPAPVVRRPGDAAKVTLAGNINEALDLWGEDVVLPPVREGDLLCLLNAGGYGSSMASQHCLRGEYTEHWLPESPDQELPPEVEAGSTLAVSNRRAWDRLYASTPDSVWGRVPVPFLEEFLGDFDRVLQSPSRVLDAGTGEGRNLPVLLRGAAQECHAIDSSASALAKIPPELQSRVHCRHAALDATGYPEAYFDVITAIDVFETLPDLGAVLAELARILKPGGVLFCNIPGLDDGIAGIDMAPLGQNAFLYREAYYYQFLAHDEAETLLARAGLEVQSRCQREWRECTHPGFRDGSHRHVSQIYLVRRRSPRG